MNTWYAEQIDGYWQPTIDTGRLVLHLQGLRWETREQCTGWIRQWITGRANHLREDPH